MADLGLLLDEVLESARNVTRLLEELVLVQLDLRRVHWVLERVLLHVMGNTSRSEWMSKSHRGAELKSSQAE